MELLYFFPENFLNQHGKKPTNLIHNSTQSFSVLESWFCNKMASTNSHFPKNISGKYNQENEGTFSKP